MIMPIVSQYIAPLPQTCIVLADSCQHTPLLYMYGTVLYCTVHSTYGFWKYKSGKNVLASTLSMEKNVLICVQCPAAVHIYVWILMMTFTVRDSDLVSAGLWFPGVAKGFHCYPVHPRQTPPSPLENARAVFFFLPTLHYNQMLRPSFDGCVALFISPSGGGTVSGWF